MTESAKKCMVCAQPAAILNGGICLACQDKICREAPGEKARTSADAERDLTHHGVPQSKGNPAWDDNSARSRRTMT